MNPKSIALSVGIVAASFFAWGFQAHRHKVFPHSLLKFAATELGILEPQEPGILYGDPPTAALAVLKTLPYITAQFDPESELRGVVEFDRNRAQSGLNFYNSDSQTSARLIDMDGNVVYGWSYDYPGRRWSTAELLSDGSLIVVIRDHVVLKIDKCSELVWSYETRVYHDVWVGDEGNIYVVTREAVQAPDIHGTIESADERITVLTADGVKQAEVSVLGLLRSSRYEYLLPSVTSTEFPVGELDPIHVNHVEVFDGSLAELSPLFERGNVLISMRNLNAIAILDGRMKEIIWLWGPNNVALQHHPRLLPSGHLLVFDNGTERSRVVELDPIGREVVWTYANGKEFYSSWGGSAQRLPNGNTLITETATGYAREVTPEGQVVWKFANPDVDSEGQRSNIWRMTRFLPSDLNFLDAGGCNRS